jgi:4-hydroxyphenylpyruvate dioxygenase
MIDTSARCEAMKESTTVAPVASRDETDFLPIKAFDHVELYVGNAKQAAVFYAHGFGFTPVAYRGLETGSRDIASYALQQGNIRLVLSSALSADHEISRHVAEHGDGVKVIALEVPDAAAAFEAATSRGARAALEPSETRDDFGVLRTSTVKAYGDTWLEFVERGDYAGAFAPGYRRVGRANGNGVGLHTVDHIVGNVELGAMNEWVEFFGRALGFTQLVHFDDKAISTEYSALMSKVMQDGSGKIKFPINEPAEGKKRSQIQEFLDFYRGPGVQHIACQTDDIVRTVRTMRERGIEFLHIPGSYYENLPDRVGEIEQRVDDLAELGILADRDEDGYLLQIFTKPVQDRPTVFYEVIERHGARGFGEGNFKALFESLEKEQQRRGNL